MKAKTLTSIDFEKLLKAAPDSLLVMSETLKFSTSNDLQMAGGCFREAAHLLERGLHYLEKGNALNLEVSKDEACADPADSARRTKVLGVQLPSYFTWAETDMLPFCHKCGHPVESVSTQRPTRWAPRLHAVSLSEPTGEIVLSITCHGEEWSASNWEADIYDRHA